MQTGGGWGKLSDISKVVDSSTDLAYQRLRWLAFKTLLTGRRAAICRTGLGDARRLEGIEGNERGTCCAGMWASAG